MTPEQLIEMARECGDFVYDPDTNSNLPLFVFSMEEIAKFAQLVAAHEREENAKIADEIATDNWNLYKGHLPYKGDEVGRADAHTQGVSMGANECADTIRARGQK